MLKFKVGDPVRIIKAGNGVNASMIGVRETMPLKLRDYQTEGATWLARSRRAVLADSPGLGKTCQALAAAHWLKSERTLIICPNHLKTNWAEEIRRWQPRAPVVILDGSTQEKRRILEEFKRTGKGFCIVNYEAIRFEKRPNPKATSKMQEVPSDFLLSLIKGNFQTAIVDEAHRAARGTLQGLGVKLLTRPRACANLFLLTGTPMRNRVSEYWHLLHLCDPKRWSSFWKFVRTYCAARPARKEWGEYGQWVHQDEATDPARLARDMAPYLLRRPREDYLDLPPLAIQTLWLQMGTEQERIYRRMEKEMLTELRNGRELEAFNVLSKITRLKQLAISPAVLEGTKHPSWLQDAKIEALRGIVEDAPADDKFIIFSQFEKVISLLSGHFDKSGIGSVQYTGKLPTFRLEENLGCFRAEPAVRALLATTQKAREGLNLQEANQVVFVDDLWTPADIEQAYSRAYRSGQTRPVRVRHLRVKGTIDEWLVAKLTYKGDINREIIGLLEARLACSSP